MKYIIITPDIAEMLRRPVTGQGGHQSLARRLRRNRVRRDGVLHLAIDAVSEERLRRYAYNYGDGGWQDRWRAILSDLDPAPLANEAALAA